MKKSVKRILCGALSLAMCSTLAMESVLRLHAETATLPSGTAATADTSFKNVTGKYDTSKIREENFNSSVLKSEIAKPVYETRTVMVTLSGENMVERAEDMQVGEYLDSWSGEVAKADVEEEQQNFLRALSKRGIPYKLERSYKNVLNAVAIELDTKYVSEIKKMQGVDSVVITTAYEAPKTVKSEGGVVLNETDVYETGIYDSSAFAAKYGAGTVVAVLDTGLDYTHKAFQNFKSDNVNYAWDREHIKNELSSKDLAAEARSGSLEVSDVYMNAKVPFAYDYADDDPDVYPSYSNHGTHVAGIIGGYDSTGYTDKDGNPITDKEFLGVVPDAQLVICKVFTDDLDDKDLGGAVTEDIVAALEDCVMLGVDVINMSLGSSCGFTTTNDGDDEGELLNDVYEKVNKSGISLICAASNDYSAGYGGVYGTNLAENPDAGTVGSPSTYAAALSVASINGQKASYVIANKDTQKQAYVFFEESRDINSNPFDFVKGLNDAYPANNGEFEYVVVPGVGIAADYTASIRSLFKDKSGRSTGRIALIKRGDSTFKEKVEVAMQMGAAGVIVYNNVAGVIRMNLGEIDNPVPSISINMNAGAAMVNGAVGNVGKLHIDSTYAAGPFMSEFSSWGPTPDLKLKPEITAHGGEITSAVPGGYGEQSGTSMATPNMAGFMAIVRSYIQKDTNGILTKAKALSHNQGISEATLINRLAMQLTMSTAGTVYDQDGLAYSPRKQGAGVAKLGNVVGGTSAYLWTEVASNDYRPKVELGDDKDKEGIYSVNFKITNFGDTTLTFTATQEFMTETLSRDKLTVSEQAHMLTSSTAAWSVNGTPLTGETISVAKGETMDISVQLTLSDEDRGYIESSFENGMYVEGFVKLLSDDTDAQCDLTLPFLGFYGDWDQAPMLDYSAYEVADVEQDASILEEDKIKASVWATQPYNIYYNDKYVLPMGGYLYLLPEDADPMYVNEDYNAVSRYNEYYGEGVVENYMTSTGIKAVYAGLLRNARVVKYKLIDEATGEVVYTKDIPRVAKAYAGGGSAVPANVKLEIYPEEEGFIANGQYRMEFEFYKDEPVAGQQVREEDTFSFSFTVDYEAPTMHDARVRYYNYKDGNKEKQRIYLDVDVYDNHYAQTLMVCYPKTDSDGDVSLQLATEYPTPIRNPKKNGITTVSVEITDIYEKYGDQLYVQLDDYALNSCLYQVNATLANGSALPEGNEFSVAAADKNVSLDIYGTHKVSLVYGSSYTGTGDASNFLWTSANPKIANVKNGEIVGLKEGKTKITVSNRKGGTKVIDVTVSGNKATTLPKVPNLSFGIIQTDTDALQKANGTVKVNPGKTIQMSIETDPWYHPMTDLKISWSSSKPEVATVDELGRVTTIKKGTAIISATVLQKKPSGEWGETLYGATSIMQVQDEFDVSNYTLNKYNGLGYNAEDGYTLEDGVLKIPDDLNVMYIGEEAFKDNKNIKKIIIPSSVVDIRARAFLNCTALEEVYFVSTEKQAIADADVAMIYENAFEGCINLKKVDFSNTKTVTLAQNCFADCTNLTEVVDMPSIGTMHHRAFANTGLTSVDLSGLHMSGRYVFDGCTDITEVTTGKFTAIGDYMFNGCTGLREKITIKTSKIGEGAFNGCTNLQGVIFDGADREFDIGALAFKNCGKNAGSFEATVVSGTIRSIGNNAFDGSALSSFDFSKLRGLETLGENAFINTKLNVVTLTDEMDIANLRLTGIPFEGLTVTVANGAVNYSEENGVIYNKDKSKLLYVNASVTGEFSIPETVKEIAAYAFAGSKVSKVIFNANLEKLGEGAFKQSQITSVQFAQSSKLTAIPDSTFEKSWLTAIDLPASVTTIGADAFASSALHNFVGNGVKEIGDRAFSSCNALTVITLPDGASKMGDRVFAGCLVLESVVMPSVAELGNQTFVGASKLSSVRFGDETTTIGSETFAGTALTVVDLSNTAINSIGVGAFRNCLKLTEIKLPSSATRIDDYAFSGCKALKTVAGIERITHFGAQAFYNSALPTLNLAVAKYVGYMAFAAYEDESTMAKKQTAAYTTLSIPVVETIESYAFFNGGMSTVSIPSTLKVLGEAAFASADNLATISIAESEYFFVKDNVLYRYADKASGSFELVCYPTALTAAGEKGSRSYEILEGTTRVLGYAFYNLNKDVLNKVTLPYTMNAIGDSAFFASGIKEYAFESMQAPTLETTYRQEVREALKGATNIAEYKGYYNTNFQTYLYHFTKYGGQKSDLIMHYPRNGAGYDNPVYSIYFGERIPSANDMMEDNTRACIQIVTEMPSAETVAGWISLEKTEDNMQMVQAFAEQMKRARLYYNNAMANEGQKGYITAEIETKLLAVEQELRAVKKAFGITPVIKQLLISKDSTHRTNYVEGEEFDMTGLVITVEYDDYSTETADFNELKLVTTGELTENKYVVVTYKGRRIHLPIKVTSKETETPNEESGCKSSVSLGAVMIPLMAMSACVFVRRKRDDK